jgi:hypothetical protein
VCPSPAHDDPTAAGIAACGRSIPLLMDGAIACVCCTLLSLSTLSSAAAAASALSQDDDYDDASRLSADAPRTTTRTYDVVVEEPEVVELPDGDEEEEVPSDEEDEADDDELIYLGTYSPTPTAQVVPVPVPASPRPPKKTVTDVRDRASPRARRDARGPPVRREGRRIPPISIGLVPHRTQGARHGQVRRDPGVNGGEQEFLEPQHRMLRIATVEGIEPEDVQKKERTRLWKVQTEELTRRVPAASL